MVVSKSEYEECRKQRLEENKKRMEQLNLNQLSQALRVSSSPNPSPAKPRVTRQPVEMFPVRRSSRVAEKPQPNYKELGLEPLKRRHQHVRRGCYKRKDLLDRIYASVEARNYAEYRAEDVQSGLESEFPNFVKSMLQSHVTGGFWLGLSNKFCKKHLPKHDEMITLVDEDGNESLTKYLADKSGLSGGWRGFSIDHELVDGDALVFQLIKPTKFKVYIIRVNEPEDGDGDDNGEEDPADGDGEEDADRDETSAVNSSTKRIKTRRS